MTEEQLHDQLRDLAGRIDPPVVPLSEDVDRGRRRLRRQRGGWIGGSVLAVGLIAGATVAVPALLSDDSDGGRSPSFTENSATPGNGPKTTERTLKLTKADRFDLGGDEGIPDFDEMATDPALQKYIEILADHLDPDYEHLQRTPTGFTGGSLDYGTKLSWKVAGESGEGMLQINVSTDWSESMICQESGAQCRDITGPRGLTGRFSTYDGGRAVALKHEDGTIVTLMANDLFGNNSLTPVSGIDVTDQQLIQAVADEDFYLPGLAGDVPAAIAAGDLARIGSRELSGPDGTVTVKADRYSSVQYPAAEGTYRGSAGSGDVYASASIALSTDGDYSCTRRDHSRCVVRTVDGQDVLIAYGKGRTRDVTVTFDGEVHDLYVYLNGDTGAGSAGGEALVDRAVSFVLDPLWQ